MPSPGFCFGCQTPKYAPARSVNPPIRPYSRTSIGVNGTVPPAFRTACAVASTSADRKYTDQEGFACSSVTVIAPPTVFPFSMNIP